MDCNGKEGHAIEVTFDDFLQLAVRAWKKGEPYYPLVKDIPEYEVDIISTYIRLPRLSAGFGLLSYGFTSNSDFEIDLLHDHLTDTDNDDEIMMVLGYPFFNPDL